MRMTLLLLVLLAQDPDLSKLIDDLTAEEAAVRERAAVALVARGDAVEPELRRRLGTAEGELKFRLQDCLARIDRARENFKVLPLYKPLDVQLVDRPLAEALAAIGLKSDGAPAKKVTLTARGVSPLEALDRLCRDSRVSWSLVAPDPRRDASLAFAEGAPPETTRTYCGHYRIAVSSVTVTRVEDFRGGEAFLKLDLAMSWPPFVRPDAIVEFELLSASDDTRRALLESKPAAPTAVLRNRAGFTRTFVLRHPAPAAATLASVKGRAVVRYPGQIEVARFAPPVDCVGQTRTVAGLKVALTKFGIDGNTLEAELHINGQYVRRTSEKDKTPAARASRSELPFEREDVRFETADGAPLQSCGSGSGSDGRSWSLSWMYRLPAEIKSIELALPADSFYDSFDFELKDVPLPKKPD
jgi:hypothetical protein